MKNLYLRPGLEVNGQRKRWRKTYAGHGGFKKKKKAGFTENEKIERWRKTKNIEEEAWKSDFYW